ncbi:tonsoku-like protein [Photinus pyralis]|uniref:tonsoku-like protein n=1 Tax=Photinus pyralis TaxID=7054 RepID=UPI0012671C27|nr:tonsoku-like protein [Photinus pyralis]
MVKTQEQKLIRRKHKALENGHQTTLASICIDLGEFYDQEERYEDAIAEFQIVADIYKEMGKLLDYGRVCRGIGEAYINLQDYEKALEYQQTYLEIAKEQGNKLEEQRALATIGHIHLTRYLNEVDNPNQHTLHSASKAFKKSLTICESLTDVKKHEHKDMITRLLANLGVVYECEGKYEKAEELLRKSIDICKTHDLFEQLQRGYTCLGTLYVRKKQYDEAIRQYNLAMEVAGRLKNKAQLVSAALQSKADILIKMADFYGARTQLLKAYKLEQSNADDRRVIEQNLKIVAAMCKVEESLLTTDNRDYVTKKNLYEKLGDGASHLKNFSYAIDCYQKMLEAATNNKDTGSQLSPCYISLAETYRDDKQYENAVKYFREDYNNSDVPREQVATLLSIADCMDAGEYDSNEIVGVYDEAHGMCRVIGDGRLSFKVLASYAAFLKRHRMHENAVKIEQHLNAINGADVDTDSEAADAVLTPNLGDDISIKDITDISDDSDTENRTTRRRTKGYVVKRNNKGETQLHTACIHGNFELVKRLITQRHPVNIRDNCGWLPIHEACICGQLEIVRLLIDNGASINDRGGTLCEGTSPLHDAALNGHLEVVQLLLDSGASSIAKNDSGQIPLQVLKAWRAGRQLDDTQEALYNGLVRRLSGEAGKLGLPEESVDLSESSAFVANCSDEEEGVVPAQRKLRDRRCSQVGNLRRNVGCDEDLDRARKKRHSTESSTSAKDEYRKVMEQMRHPTREKSGDRKRKSTENIKQSVYVEGDDDNWLENDVASTSKKRKTTSATFRRHSSASATNLLPVPASEIHTRTIKWLADEASLRFSRKECMKPDLELETKNGAVLADDDFISVLFSAGLSHAEEVEARITKWNLLPLSERYAEACAVETIAPSDELMKILETVSISLSLANLNLGDRKISPLCRVINRQLNLHSLNLSGNFIHDDCFQVLCTSLPTLENLCDLNLSLNQLTCVSLRYLTEVFTQTPTPVLANLTKLDLSHNPLGNESLNFLSVITRHLKLKTLNLADVDFTGGLFASEQQADLNLDSVSNFDVGYNRLGNDEIATFLSWLKPQNIESLNLGDCSEIGEGLVKSVVEWMQTRGNTGLPLKVLNLSRTCATDNEIFELLRYLTIASQLFSINLSYNASLTTPSLRRVLESCPTVTHLNLTGCDNIVKNLECCTEEFWNGVRLRELKLSGDFEKYARAKETVVNMWKSIHNGGARVLQLRNFLHFSLVK